MIFGRCGGRRSNANMTQLCGLAADFDIGPDDPRYVSFHDMCDRMERDGYAFAAYTTTANDMAHNRYRLVMPYAAAISPELHPSAWKECDKLFHHAIDGSTKDAARLSFLPADWTENPFVDPAKGLVTLTDPFNAIRVSLEGKPILTSADLVALVEVSRDDRGNAHENRHRERIALKPYAVTPEALTAAERQSLAQGKSSADLAWNLLTDLRRSPLVKPWVRDKLPFDAGGRDYRFMTAVATKAVQSNLPITTDVIVTLAEQFSRELLHRNPPHDAARQAENALAWAFRNFGASASGPSQPDVGT